MERTKIAVVGLGPTGLTALKCLREEGFDAVAFERRDKIGGLWSFSNNTTYTSALNETTCNVSKFVSSFSDFPIPTDYPAYPSSAMVAQHFDSYASHFNLHQHVRFNSTVVKVTRNALDNAWDVYVTNAKGHSETLTFDKVVFSHGAHSTPVLPQIPGREMFRGLVIHSQAYRGPSAFQDKKVVVIGLGNTACEAAISLTGHASKVYQSYRRGRLVVSRYDDHGVPVDSGISWPVVRLKHFLDSKVPWLTIPLLDKFMLYRMINDAARSEPAESGVARKEVLKRTEHRIRDEWHLWPGPSMADANPAVQENFIPALRRGDITPLRGIKGFIGEREILLEDDTVVEADAVIFATGYNSDFSIIPELELDGACGLPLRTAGEVAKVEEHSNSIKNGARDDEQPHMPRLFQMIFPPRRADSIAVLNWFTIQDNVWTIAELCSMAVAQTWAAETARAAGLRNTPAGVANENRRPPALLPSLEEMNAQIDGYHAWWRGQWKKDHQTLEGFVQGYSWYRFLHNAAGTGVYEHIDHIFTGRGWWLWWNDRDLWTWMARGPVSGLYWRVFDTNPEGVPGCGRKVWPGAREALQTMYEHLQEHRQQMHQRSSKVE